MTKKFDRIVLLLSLFIGTGWAQSGGTANAWILSTISAREAGFAGAGAAASTSPFMGLVNPAAVVDVRPDRPQSMMGIGTRLAGPWVPYHALFQGWYDLNMVAINHAPKENGSAVVPFVNQVVVHRTVKNIIHTQLNQYDDIQIYGRFTSTELMSATTLGWILPSSTRIGATGRVSYSNYHGYDSEIALTGLDVGIQDELIENLTYGVRFSLNTHGGNSAVEGIAGVKWEYFLGNYRLTLLSDIVSGQELEFRGGLEASNEFLRVRGGMMVKVDRTYFLGGGIGLRAQLLTLPEFEINVAYNYYHERYSDYLGLIDAPYKVSIQFDL